MTVTETVRADPPPAPDRDFETLRAQAMALLAAATQRWTDHNASDPGVTVTEAVAWGYADLHYRTGTFPLDGWSAEAGLWRPYAGRHWTGVPLPEDHAELAALAAALASLPDATVAAVRRAVVPGEAVRDVGVAAGLTQPLAAAAVRLLRMPLLLRAGLDGGAAVAAAAEMATEPAALAALRLDPAFDRLWDDELRALLRRERRRTLAREIRDRTEELRALVGSSASFAAAETAVAALLGVGATEARDAVAVHPNPPGALPEMWESAAGSTKVWPPHPLQARTVEPVTADDYARLARAVPGVRRAWVVPEVLPGIGWDGSAVTTRAARPGAVTLLVEATTPPTTAAARQAFLREVLRTAIGTEVDNPFVPEPPTARRTICDEVGAALLDRCPVTLRGVLHVPTTADRVAVRDRAMAAVAAFFERGRAETAVTPPVPEFPRDTDGPWPYPGPQPGGWRPGDPVRIPELVQVISADPDVYGVEALEVRVPGGVWEPDALLLEPQCVPRLGEEQCVAVTLELAEECGDAC